ncbi:MAG TPA: hypothetical protein VM327_02280 [Candidatus Thermoplasmatota archaeon]|nr:hypothetical protein [Candidatus Thermoplasmatota archaeon]
MEFSSTGLLVLLHVLFASLWFGGGVFQVAIIGRGLMKAGPAAGGFVVALMKNGGIGRFFAISGILSIVFGGILYGREKISDAPFDAARNLWITMGAILAVMAFIHGMAFNMPNERKLIALCKTINGPPTKDQVAQMQALGMKLGKYGSHGILMVGLAMLLMLLSRVFV